ncbi:MAG: arginase family protein [Nanoarchaeota archaeon]|nr:arginase family protein [Nanoarchaeota archaeon]
MQIIKVPGLNGLGKNLGCRNAGNAILGELKEFKDISALKLEEIHVDNLKLDEQEKLISENSKEVLETGEKIIFLGGDHSISFPIGKSFLDIYGKKDSYLIVFDAHADCMPAMKEPTHEEWLRALVEFGWKPENIYLIGLRKIELEERRFLNLRGIKYIEMEKIQDFEIFCDGIMEFANKKNANVYLSIDIDIVDPAFAPSTGYLEPGGFSAREILYFAKRLALLKSLKAIDIVEIDCEKDKQKENITVKLGARILQEFLK